MLFRSESFRPFLRLFNIAVGEVAEIEEAVKFRQLCNAVFPGDLNGIIGLSYQEAIAYLKNKYTSAAVMRAYLFQKLGSLDVHDDGDLKGMRALKDAAATAVLVASQCDDKTVLIDLFDWCTSG